MLKPLVTTTGSATLTQYFKDVALLGGARGVGARGPALNLGARSKDLEKTLEKKLREKT